MEESIGQSFDWVQNKKGYLEHVIEDDYNKVTIIANVHTNKVVLLNQENERDLGKIDRDLYLELYRTYKHLKNDDMLEVMKVEVASIKFMREVDNFLESISLSLTGK